MKTETRSWDWKTLWRQFKAFALRGNITDLAVAFVIGAAFTGVVNSLVKDVVMPLLSYVNPTKGATYATWHLGRVRIGSFIGEVVNFIVIAGAMFLIVVKLLGTIQRVIHHAGPDEPTTKECPFCLSVIPARATKCAHCTAELPGPEPTAPTATS